MPTLLEGAKADPTQEQIDDESRRIRRLRILVQLTVETIAEGGLTAEEASGMIAATRRVALEMFPGKERAFDLIYRPQFQRVMHAVYRLQWPSRISNQTAFESTFAAIPLQVPQSYPAAPDIRDSADTAATKTRSQAHFVRTSNPWTHGSRGKTAACAQHSPQMQRRNACAESASSLRITA